MNKSPSPPKFLLSFFRWFCHPDYVEDIEGDLLERYDRQPSNWIFFLEVIKLLRFGLIHKSSLIPRLRLMDTLQNDVKIAYRNLKKHKTYVLINMLGMGFALACCLVSFLNLDYKLRFDEHHQLLSVNVYRVNTTRVSQDGKEDWGLSPVALGNVLQDEVPGVEKFARLNVGSGIVKSNGKSFSEKIHLADMSLIEMLNFPLVYGSISNLKGKNAIVLSRNTAQKYYSDQDPVGKEIQIYIGDQKHLFTVGAVTQKVPENTSILFDVLMPFDEIYNAGQDWTSNDQISIFLELSDKTSPGQVSETLSTYAKSFNEGADRQFTASKFYLQPFSELALTSDIDLPNWVRGRMLNRNAVGFLVGITSILSLLILITASFNFTNTAIAFSGNRLKEIGVRKVIGGTRTQLIGQLLIENILLCLISVVVAFIIAHYLILAYNGLFEQTLDLRYALEPRVLSFIIGFPLLVGVLSGIYPSIKISKYQPVQILKGKTTVMKMGWLSRSLLVGQFIVACFAIVGAIVLTQNADYQQQLDFGYGLHEVQVIAVNQSDQQNELIEALKQTPILNNIAGSSQIIGQSTEVTIRKEKEDLGYAAQELSVGVNYLETVGIELIQGRGLQGVSDQENAVINEKLAAELGYTDPIGKDVYIGEVTFTVVGIVKNHKEFGLTQEEPGCIFTYASPSEYHYISASSIENSLEVLGRLEQAWYQINPNQPFNGFGQSMLIYKQLHINSIIRNLCLFLAMATMMMSAAGFYSIVSLSVQKRTKEVGIRKVFGATISHMIRLILKDFVVYIFAAFIVGSVLATLLIEGVLFGHFYAYHMQLGLASFAMALSIMVLVPGLTVGLKVFKAASANPVHTLRDE